MNPLEIDTALVRRILTDFIRTEIHKAGFSRAVLGLSGGIDSALSCALAAEALGAENVLAVCMPYKTSAPESLEDAQRVIDRLGVQHKTIEITPMAEAFMAGEPSMSALRRGNIMARCRMIILYDQSAAFNGLVVGTSNKSEILLGYSTLYGDSACALNPLGDLYKAQVRQLARAMDIPPEIIEKAPSADLWQGQTDEAELGFTYAEADALLYRLVDERYTPQECVEQGFAPPLVAAIVRRLQRYQFKRVAPPIAKLSQRTVGYDFLYLRDWTL